jgi:hypothetical protein
MSIRRAAGYLGDSIRKYGVGATLHDLKCRLINKAVQFQILKGMTVRTRDVREPGLFKAPGFDARFLREGELWLYVQDPAHQMTPEFLSVARARGDRCYALVDLRQGNLAAYGWYSDRSTPLDRHFELHFDRAWAYMYKGYTMPAYRGKRLHAIGMCRALRALSGEGRKGLISCVASNNFASLHSVTRMGYRVFGDVYLLHAAGRSFTHATMGCRPYGFWVEPLPPARGVAAARDFSKS